MNEFAGIPVRISPYVPENEVWLIDPGERAQVVAHEGPKAGQTVEEWLRPPTVVKLINIGFKPDEVPF